VLVEVDQSGGVVGPDRPQRQHGTAFDDDAACEPCRIVRIPGGAIHRAESPYWVIVLGLCFHLSPGRRPGAKEAGLGPFSTLKLPPGAAQTATKGQ
jgi:hypothetical protein